MTEVPPEPGSAYRPIGDYAIIGDCRSAALISSDGSIDWLCLPRFDSPSIFGALLDDHVGGRFRIRPVGPFTTSRRYAPASNVLETTFATSSGRAVLRDLMPVWSEEEKDQQLVPDHEILREIEVLDGQMEIEVLYEPRPEYGKIVPRLQQRGRLGLWCADLGPALIFTTDFPIELIERDHTAWGRELLQAGERRHCSLSYTEGDPAVLPLLGDAAHARVERSIRWWQDWASHCTYQGPYQDMVVRSALTLKLLAYAPSGAIVAAATTSLPESIGGSRNWDYRFCWLRDASFTMRALCSLGFGDEAEAFLGWMLHATRLSGPNLQVMYDVFGESRLAEKELAHLEGYERSRPVRIGNGAHDQLQLDIFGEVVDAAAEFAAHGGTFDRDTRRLLTDIGRAVCRRWQEPDQGIWETRAGAFQHTHSKVLCWAALDRLVRMHEAGLLRTEVDLFRATAGAIRAQIEERGFNPEISSYTQVFDGTQVDASLLALPHFGYIGASDPRMQSTVARIQRELGANGLLYRYRSDVDDGLPPREGAFGVCGFWAVECIARSGDRGRAARDFQHLLGFANDVGLYAEELDPENGSQLGNFPQAFTHIGLINAALTLLDPDEKREL